MAKGKRTAHRDAGKASARGISRRKRSDSDMAIEDQLMSSSLSLHELFQQQTRQILDRTDLEEEQKQNILVAMSCPCCGAGAMSFTAKLRR